MAVATYDIKKIVGQNRRQTTGRVEIAHRIDFSKINSGAGLAAGEDCAIFTIPKGYVHERLDPVERTAEGAAGNIDVGTEADPNGFGDGLDVNGAANASIALAGTETLVPGTYFHVDTEVRVSIAAAQPTVDAAVVDLTLVGYMIDTE